jgi:carboxyl-terminal processing protease
MRRILTILTAAALLVAACGDGISTAPEGQGPIGKFDKVWQDFDEHYAYFEYGNIDWTALREKYRSQVTPSMPDGALASVIGSMLGELRDYHADLSTSFGTFGPPPIPYPQHFSPALLQTHYFASPIRRTASGHVEYTRLVDGTGFIYIGSFRGDGWGGEINDALTAIGSVPALIIDIRNNGGGNEAVAQEVASKFYDVQRVYRLSRYRVGRGHADFGALTSMSVGPKGQRYTAPVALITNRFNGSAAEEFVLMMRLLPAVTTVGDTTLGLGSNPLQIGLSNGWTYRVPQSIQTTPDGFIYQWRGLPPAIPVPWAEADTAAGHDPYVDAALHELYRRIAVDPVHDRR